MFCPNELYDFFDGLWNNDANFFATTPPILTPSQVDELYSHEEQPRPIWCGINASLRDCERNHEWHSDSSKLMSSPMRRIRPQQMVRPYLTLWDIHRSPGSEKLSSQRIWKGELVPLLLRLSLLIVRMKISKS